MILAGLGRHYGGALGPLDRLDAAALHFYAGAAAAFWDKVKPRG